MERYRKLIFTIGMVFITMGMLGAQDVIITSVSSTPVSCGNGNDGTITVNVSGGIGAYTFLLVKGAVPVESSGAIASPSFTFTGHSKYSNYIVIVSDSDPGTADGFTFATIDGAEPMKVESHSSTDISCNNLNDGTITVSASGEKGNYVFDLNGPLSQSNGSGVFTGLPEGNYVVTVRDADGCPSTDNTPVLNITNPPAISITIDNSSNVDCYGENTASISITPAGGSPSASGTGYSYAWTGPNGFSSGNEDIANLEAGSYSVTVYDAKLCAETAGPINITQQPELTVSLISSSDASCHGSNDGTASITPGGGAGNYSYSWDGQLTGLICTDEDPVNLLADVYDLTIFDGLGCERTFPSFVTIDEPEGMTVAIDSHSPVSCNGGNDGSAEITVTGGTGPLSFSWSGQGSGFSSTDEDPNSMPADSYDLEITDANGCNQSFTSFVTITEPTAVSVVLNSTSNISCHGENTGRASITVSGGSTPYSFNWTGKNTGAISTAEDPVDLLADTYELTITDNNGCIYFYDDFLTLTEPADISVSIDQLVDVNCNGEATGAIAILVSGGTPNYSFAWTGPDGFSASTKDLSGLKAGEYSLSITDANGCEKSFLNLATIQQNTAISASFSLNHLSCNGGSDGAIDITPSGGTPDYSYSWTGPNNFSSTDEDISGLLAGSYTLTITDALNCSQSMPAQELTEPAGLTVTATTSHIDCFGANNGHIDLDVSGGSPPYSFAWTGPSGFTSASEDISGLAPGSYSIDITDSNGCSKSYPDIATINESPEIKVLSTASNISCGGLTDGTIDIAVSGGTGSYSFAWSGPSGFTATTEDISGLSAGSYSLEVSDGNGCMRSFPNIETIVEPSIISAAYLSHTDVLCKGESTGSIQVDVSGGVPPYLFNWTIDGGGRVSTDEDPGNLAAGTYSLEVSDANGCNIVFPNLATISEPPELISTLSANDLICYGDNNGEISISTTGGTGPYEYSRVGNIDPGYQSSSTFSGLGPGLYNIWTRDANRCVVLDTISIQEPEEIQIVGETKSGQNLCYGDSSGQISIDEVTGGMPPYVYSIDGGSTFHTSPLFTNLPAGNYQTIVRDANGCASSGNLNVITQPADIQIDSYGQVDISSCYDAREGRILITASGGNGIITYTLNDTLNSTIGDFQLLPVGNHTIRMEDENRCTKDTSVVLTAPPPIVVNSLTIAHVSGCNGDTNGSIDISGTGGSGGISYAINGGGLQAGGLFNNLGAGNYTLSLVDTKGCSFDSTVEITEPGPILITAENKTEISCAGAANGQIEMIVSGGTAPLNYSLNPGAISNTSGVFTMLAPGTYTVSVNDAEGCGPIVSGNLVFVDPPVFSLDSVKDRNISCNGAADASIGIFASGGVRPYSYSVDNRVSWSADSLFTGLDAGSYEAWVRDANGCVIYAGAFNMSDPAALILDATSTDITPCAGDANGVIEAQGSGGTGAVEYSIDGLLFQTEIRFEGLSAGDYTLHARDAEGCLATKAITLSEPEPVSASIAKTDAINGNLGTITISNATGGTGPYEFSIDGSGGTFSSETFYDALSAGSYNVVVRDANACLYEETVNILDTPPLDIDLNIVHLSCNGTDDGSIEFIPLNAAGAVEYSIDSGQNLVTNPLFEKLPGDSLYHLFARDSEGKEYRDTITIQEPEAIEIASNISPATCNSFSATGSIDITVTGGTGGYSFSWSDGNSDEDRTALLAGSYTLEVTDANECSETASFEVSSLITVEANAGADTAVCEGTSFQLHGLGGHSPSWEPSNLLSDAGVADPVVSGLSETTTFIYTITEENSGHNCSDSDTLTVTLLPKVEMSITPDTLVFQGESLQLMVGGGPFTSYRWEPGTWLNDASIANPLSTPIDPIRYTVYVVNEYGCEQSDSVFVDLLLELTVYNVFTPNNDSQNDYFEIDHAELFPEMLVEVYNRWGRLLFSTKGYGDDNRWDGTSGGKDVPVGTYYYIIVPYSGAKAITGNVTIIR